MSRQLQNTNSAPQPADSRSEEKKRREPAAAWLEPNRLVALIATLLLAALLVVVLLVVHLHLPQKPAEPKSELQMAAIEPDEVPPFIDPLLMENSGEQAEVQQEAAPTPDGTPDQAPEPQPEKVVSGKNPTPNPSQEKLVSSKQPSPKKTAEPTPKEKKDSRISDNMKGQFSPHNGKPGGSSQPSASSGSGGKGTGATGKLKGGRKLLRWSAPSVRLQKKERVVVNVWVDADGNVTRAEAVSGPDNLRSACVKASLKAKWEKGSAPSTRGSITWTLVPATR